MDLSPGITETRRVHFPCHTSSYRFLKAAFASIRGNGARYRDTEEFMTECFRASVYELGSNMPIPLETISRCRYSARHSSTDRWPPEFSRDR
jgi:hypothetical protein